MPNNIRLENPIQPVNITLATEPTLVPVGVDANYVHTQSSASNSWNVNHNLDKYCSVTVVDSNNEIIYGNIVYSPTNGLNELTITFNAQITGKAYLN
jgi:hypothetical protein